MMMILIITPYPLTASDSSSARTNDPAMQLLVYPGQAAPLANTPSQRYQAHRQTNRQTKHNCSLLEEILTTILNEKKKKLRR